MGQPIKIRKGLNIRLIGEAEKTMQAFPVAKDFALKPTDFHGVRPGVFVKAGDEVKVGTPVYYNKFNEKVKFCSPVSGVVKELVRGEKRKLLEIVIESDNNFTSENVSIPDYAQASAEDVKQTLLNTGLWPMFVQRPYGVIADTEIKPDFVFVSGFDTAPLSVDYAFVLAEMKEELKVGFEILHKLSQKDIHLGVSEQADNSIFEGMPHVKTQSFEGPHPAGNVGTQINKVRPINKGEIYWTLNIQDVAVIGRLFLTKTLDYSRIIALSGGELNTTGYVKVIQGQSVKSLIDNNLKQDGVRVISGNVLTGVNVGKSGYLSYNSNQLSVIPEGDYYELFGWIASGFKKFSLSRTFISWMFPKRKYNLDTNYHGGERAYVITGEYEKVCPLNIYPQQLIKACITNDIDKMEQLGIYEVIEEDLALCEFVCTSKIEVQSILRNSLDMLREEMS